MIWKTNFILNIIIDQPDIDKIYLYAIDLINQNTNFQLTNEKKTTLTCFKGSKAFIEYSNDTDNIYVKH